MLQKSLTGWGFPGLRLLAGFNSDAAAADWLGVSERTLRRQKADCSAPVWRLLAMKAGWLELIDPAWAGWSLQRGRLRYGGQDWRPGDILAQQYERALIAELRRQVRSYEAQQAAAADARPRAPVLRLDDYR